MKRTMIQRMAAFIMAAACLDACNIEEYDAYQPEVPEIPAAGTVTLTAGINEDAATKVALGDDSGSSTKVFWSKGDSFALVDGGKRYVFVRNDQSEAELASAEFTYNEEEGELPDISKEGLKFVYPCVTPAHYSAQSGTEEGLSDFMGMEAAIPENVSEWQGMSLNFRHTTAVVKMVLSNEAFKDAEVEVKLYAEGLLPDGNMISTGKLQGDSQGCVTAYVVVPVTGNNLNDCTIYVKTADNVYETTLGGNTMQAGKMYKVTKSNLTESTQVLACHLPVGGVFNSAVKAVLDANASLVKLKFIACSNATGTEIADCGAYMVENGDCLEIHTAELEFEFHQYCINMFSNLEKITDINFNNVINTSNVTGMNSMFSDCSSLTTLDVSGFDTSNVTNMSYMFYYCSSLTTLDVSSFDTSNVTDMRQMFWECSSLTTLNVLWFDTSNVTDMYGMFRDCSSLTTLDVSSFDTSNVTDISSMFQDCSSLTTLDVSGFDTSNVTDMRNMFSSCSNLNTLDLSGFDTSNVTYISSMFQDCSSLTTLDVSGFDTSNVTVMYGMFRDCSSLTTLDVSSFDTSNVTDMDDMFFNCSSLTILDVSGFDTSNVTDMSTMFRDCSSLTTLDVSSFDTSNVTDMSQMFSSCSNLSTLDLSGFDTSNVTDMDDMFFNCSSLTTLDVSGFDTSNVTDMSRMFCSCSSLTTLDVTGFDTSIVTDMDSMFHHCSSLTTLDLTGFKTSNVTDMDDMFFNCSSLTTLDVSGFDTSNVTDMSRMFCSCSSLTGLDLESFDFQTVMDVTAIFNSIGCEASNKPISIKVAPEGYEFLVSKDTGIYADYAILVDSDFCHLPVGMRFNDSVEAVLDANASLVKLKFVAGSSATGTPIMYCDAFMVENGDCLEIHTAAQEFEFNQDCSVMFHGLENITHIYFNNVINTSNVTDMSQMFRDCSSLTTLDVTGFDTSNVTHMGWMFDACSGLTTLDVSGFDTSNVTDMGSMFYLCSSLTTLDVSGFDTSNVTNMNSMFYCCYSLTTLNVLLFDTAKVTDMSYMFCGCRKLEELDLVGFDTPNVANMRYMFEGCCELKGLDLRWFDFSNVTSFVNMFSDLARDVEEKPIEIKVKREGYINLKSKDTGLNTDYAELVIYD